MLKKNIVHSAAERIDFVRPYVLDEVSERCAVCHIAVCSQKKKGSTTNTALHATHSAGTGAASAGSSPKFLDTET